MPTIRPYDPAFAQRAVALGDEGLSRAEIAKGLGASFIDFDAWAAEHAAFAVALADAETSARAWWDGEPRRALTTNRPFRATIWAKVMAQRFGSAAHPSRQKAEKPAGRPVVKARYEIPDNGKERRPRGGKGGT